MVVNEAKHGKAYIGVQEKIQLDSNQQRILKKSDRATRIYCGPFQ